MFREKSVFDHGCLWKYCRHEALDSNKAIWNFSWFSRLPCKDGCFMTACAKVLYDKCNYPRI